MTDPSYSGPRIEARRGSGSGSSFVEVPRELRRGDLEKEAGVYGSRQVEVEDKGGTTRWEEVPLLWEDLFDPQEGDRLMHSPEHGGIVRDTGARLDCLYDARGRDDVAVYDDVRFDWKTVGVAPACPDIAVIPGKKRLAKGERPPKSFNEAKEGKGPCFVLEITSEKTAEYDRTSKPEIYRQAKVPEIFLLDALKSPWELGGKRRNPRTGRYRKIRPDRRGRLLAETLGVYFRISASGDDLVLEDAETGEVMRKPVAESRARRAAERQAAAEAEARQAAERQAAAEAEARRREAEARQAAERQAAAEAEARRREAEARAVAEVRVRELLARVEHLESSAD